MTKSHSISFEIEKLERAKDAIKTESYKEILKDLILSEHGSLDIDKERLKVEFGFEIIAHNKVDADLVNLGYHAFFNGMHIAYAEHRPFVLSPDIIWLLISQGFAKHINNHSEKLRHHFVNFNSKLSLMVSDDRIDLDNPDSPWEEIFSELTENIEKHVGKEVVETLTSDFSTSTHTEKIASQITIMEAVKSYFQYNYTYAVCGIPELTLEGTTDDWEKVKSKVEKLKKYELEWWIDELIPILDEFIEASKKTINLEFWRNMFKYHTPDDYGEPEIIDGWIIKFFPYDKYGNKTKAPIWRDLAADTNLPEELVKVDLSYLKIDENGSSVSIPLELWAGFMGLEQNSSDLSLRPKIGWMIRKKDVNKRVLKEKFDVEYNDFAPIWISVKDEIPSELSELSTIQNLAIVYEKKIFSPEGLKKVNIQKLVLCGKTNFIEELKIIKSFPDTLLVINDFHYVITKKNNNILRLLLGKVYFYYMKIKSWF